MSLSGVCVGKSRLDRVGFLGPIRVGDGGVTNKVGEGYRGMGSRD